MPIFTVAAIKRPVLSVNSTATVEPETVLVPLTTVTAPDEVAAIAMLGRLIPADITDFTGIDLKAKAF